MIDALEELSESPVALDLNCGAEYVGREDDPLHELAFWSADDAQAWARQQKETA